MTAEQEVESECEFCKADRKGSYQMAAVCSNCGWRGVFILSKGHNLNVSKECPNCGCMRLMSQGDPQFNKPRLST